mmetsp:Transcript_13507/g.34668  ORF Transcript_13507/g.34668 Transcript_13507/m.34668 type:complete len:694 (-) Transcript_13507:52-2133(-)|eukprot:CAMPEP_0182917804 /NCGR_PEP_ID=MMETSP0105_2-20130417/1717_1 /TAXON_ID=81532 ORGANISM="Acanthoeca-like sp., Strain 10tr" /NCGR_SAMPLE_ID=MMETSP0105_2 /ASSEMBLY_ACC=CAM_ASM_000205 /LENGTH=693 /DNA_ID=CAMNT_0025054823 /DNA_START=97 /DNA_END=2178 /DNA_ORIENTATION=-
MAAKAQNGGDFVNKKLNVEIPWDELVASNNLQKLLFAIVQRLDRHEKAISSGSGGDGNAEDSGLVVIEKATYDKLLGRLEVVENTQYQAKLQALGQDKDLEQLAAERQSQFKLAQHVIPLAALKKRVETCEANFEINSQAIDDVNNALTETVKVLNDTLKKELAKMVTKEEFKVLENKHNTLKHRVDELEKDIKERLEKMIKECMAKIEVLTERVETAEEKIDEINDRITQVSDMVKAVETRVTSVEEILPTKADRAELEAAIQEIRDELEAMNIEEIMAMAEKANERIDAMDERVDTIEDDIRGLREYVQKKQQELEDMQLEKQIESLRRELEEAKTGVFMKATARMDEMQADTDKVKEQLADTQGRVQINRENIEELEQVLRDAGAQISTASKGGGTKALVERLQNDVAALQERYAEAARKEAEGLQSAEKTEALVEEIQSKMKEIATAKADKKAVDKALQIKADKDAVARDTEANQRAVDAALSTMNAGTQGIQQLLERQEGQVIELETKFDNKIDRDELEMLREQMSQMKSTGGSDACSTDQAEALYGAYGVSGLEAAGMSKPLGRYNCLTCMRPIAPTNAPPLPALPLLGAHGASGRTLEAAYVPASSPNRLAPMGKSGSGDSIVDVVDLQSRRSVGGAHTSTRRDLRSARSPLSPPGPGRQREVVGEDNRVYLGRESRSPQRPQSRH